MTKRWKANTKGDVGDPNEEISFIADTGASEHIINKAFVLSNFRKCIQGAVKSANKNQSADIRIDGMGNLTLSNKSGKVIERANVIEARNIACNLLSLRKFFDLGLSVYLDNQKIRVYDKSTGITYVPGDYVKPNWQIY